MCSWNSFLIIESFSCEHISMHDLWMFVRILCENLYLMFVFTCTKIVELFQMFYCLSCWECDAMVVTIVSSLWTIPQDTRQTFPYLSVVATVTSVLNYSVGWQTDLSSFIVCNNSRIYCGLFQWTLDRSFLVYVCLFLVVLLCLTQRLTILPRFAVRDPRHYYIAHSLGTLTLLFEDTITLLSCDNTRWESYTKWCDV